MKHLENKATYLKYELHNLYETKSTGPNSVMSRPLPGVEGNAVINAIGKLALLTLSFERIRIEKPPYPVAFNDDGNTIISTPTLDSFVDKASLIIHGIEELLEIQRKNIKTMEHNDFA